MLGIGRYLKQLATYGLVFLVIAMVFPKSRGFLLSLKTRLVTLCTTSPPPATESQQTSEVTPLPEEGEWKKQEAPQLSEKVDKAWERIQETAILPKPVQEPSPTPVVAVPAKIDLASLAQTVGQLPRIVAFKEPVSLPARLNGQLMGSVQVPARTQVKLLSIRGEQLSIEYQGFPESVPAKSTDIVERLQAMPPAPIAIPKTATPLAGAPPATAKIVWPVSVPVQELLASKPISTYPKKDPSVRVAQGSFEVKSKLYGNPTIKVLYRIPLKADGSPGPYANNIIFYAPFAYQIFKDDKFDRFPAYTDEYGATLFTLEIKTDFENRDDPATSYYYSESGSFEAVFEAQRVLTEKYKLKPRKLLVTGKSGGANMAKRLGIEYPDKVDAVALFAITRFADITKPSDVKWMIEHTRNDFFTEQDKEFVSQLRELGMNPLYTTISPAWGHVGRDLFHHEAGDDKGVMLELFIPALMGLRESHEGKIPPEEEWPYLASKSEPQRVMKNEPAYVQRIEKKDRLYFPSWDFAEHWTKLPPEAQEIQLPKGADGEFVRVMARFPLVPPKGVIVFCQSWEAPDDENYAAMSDNLDYLAKEGYVALSPNYEDNRKNGAESVQSTTRWAAETFRQWPLFIAGTGEGGPLAFQTAMSSLRSSIKGAAVVSMEVEDVVVSPNLKSTLPCLFLYGEKENELDAAKVEKGRNLARTIGQEGNFILVSGVGSTLENKWYGDGVNKVLAFFQKQVTPKK